MKIIPVTVIIPIHNSETTLKCVLESLEKQAYPISTVLLIDNKSSDSSLKIALEYVKKSKLRIEIIENEKDRGLSSSYNRATNLSKTPYLITLQSDCVIVDDTGVEKLLDPFLKDAGVVTTCSLQTTPWDVWKSYNFWQKALFSRHVGRILSGRNGRFCCFSLEALKKIGGFDEENFRTAGEDGDVLLKLSKIGKVVDVDTIVHHLHNRNNKFSLKDYIYKENQLAEAVGANLAKSIFKTSLLNYRTAFIRPLLLAGLLIPKFNIVFLLATLVSGVYFTKELFLREWKSPKIILLLSVNIFLIFSYTFYFLKGFITGKQRL